MQASRRRLIGSMGLVLVAPAQAWGQSQRTYRIGMMALGRFGPLDNGFFAALAQRGWNEGENLRIDVRVTAGEQERAPAIAAELLKVGADLLVTVTTANAVAARQASRTIPIVMLGSGFPVESGLAESLARPGGNVTGLCVYAGDQLFGKYVSLFKELVPSLRNLGVLWGYAPPAYPKIETDLAIGAMRAAAEAAGINVRHWMNGNRAELAANLEAVAGARLDGLFVSAGGPASTPEGVAEISAFCAKRRLPTMSDIAGIFFTQGGLLTYSVDFAELGVRGAYFVDRILRGAKPAELPIEQPTRFELVVNAKRAKAIGFAVPPAILLRADRVIE
jgi:putative ABC transport system substrate-binding protein